jgi:glycosyltransferase involved in cell wall biosynthesis
VKVSGFTIARNAIKLGYPIELSMRSLLPLVDELVVAVGDSEDKTWEVVVGIGDPKIKPFHTVWDPGKRVGGQVLAEQTNLALARCTGDWAVYLQTDELLHESEIGGIRRRMERYLPTPVEGLSFQYVHFYGSYETVQDNWCVWYRREVRAVKTGKGVVSVGDAAGFRVSRDGTEHRLIRADAGAHVYHYGWVRPPSVMTEKRQSIRRLYRPDDPEAAVTSAAAAAPPSPYRDLGNLRYFHGAHPALMTPLIAARDWSFDGRIEQQPPTIVRYARLMARCPRDFARITVSRLRLAWNTYMPTPKLR